jgi:butyrate kinase
MDKKILVINPGSTSTKIAVFYGEKQIFQKNISHSLKDIAQYERIIDQYDFRKKVIIDELKQADINLNELDAIVGRGGLLKPIESGTYLINGAMIKSFKNGEYGEHASNLGGMIAYNIGNHLKIPSYIVDPVVVDEMEPLARLSGMPELTRISIFHALNQKAVGRKAASNLGKKYEDINLIIVHLGGGISVGAHKKGKVIDVNNALNGDGPYTPERTGGLPSWPLIELVLSGKYNANELKKKIKGKGGVVAYLGTNDMREVEEKVLNGDKKYRLIFEGMAYQVSKEVGALSAVLKGEVDAIVLTGGLAYSKIFTEWIKERVGFISKILIYPGEDEMKALALGCLRVLTGEEKAKKYN